jgi:E3 ubiquitin-protein ligase RNF217
LVLAQRCDSPIPMPLDTPAVPNDADDDDEDVNYEDLFDDDDDFDEDFDDDDEGARVDVPSYPCGDTMAAECFICYSDTSLRPRLCCSLPACDECMTSYLSTKVEERVVKVVCLNNECSSYIHRDEILARLPEELKVKYYQYLVEANKDPNVKTCPRCSHIHKRVKTKSTDDRHVQRKNSRKLRDKDKNMIACPSCEQKWCFECHAPWHEGLSCRDFRKGDKLLMAWAKTQRVERGINAQKCPKCRVSVVS